MQSLEQIDFEELDAALQSAPALSTRLFRKVLQGCTRLESLRQLRRVATLEELADAGAWTDATLRLLELELPNWVVRRLIREGDDGSVPYPANRICPSRSMTRWKGSMRHFRSPSCGRSPTRAAELARKSGRLCGFLKFASRRESLCAATILFEGFFAAASLTWLYRFYEDATRSVSNSYPLKRTFGSSETNDKRRA
jgi:hypothetical protein